MTHKQLPTQPEAQPLETLDQDGFPTQDMAPSGKTGPKRPDVAQGVTGTGTIRVSG